MVCTRRSRRSVNATALPFKRPKALSVAGDVPLERARRGRKIGVMTRKQQLVHQVQKMLAARAIPTLDNRVDEEEWEKADRDLREGMPRRSQRGIKKLELDMDGDVTPSETVVWTRELARISVNLPPMISTQEGKLLAVEVFGEAVLAHLPPVDKGPRVGHCASGFVCGYPVPRGKEGNLWCQTPVKASIESKMACTHHLHRRKGAGAPALAQTRWMLLAEDYYGQNGELSWLRVLAHLRASISKPELRRRKEVLTIGVDRAVALCDAKVVLHGSRQCTLFWLLVCRLTRRGYPFRTVPHGSKAEFRDYWGRSRGRGRQAPSAQASSPFVCIGDLFSDTDFCVSGYENICRIF